MDCPECHFSGQSFLEIERLSRDDVDGAGNAAIDDIRLAGLVNDGLADKLRWHQAKAHAATTGGSLVADVPIAGT